MPTISIIGTGLMGTSLALALKQSALRDLSIIGTDLEQSARSGAQKSGAFDRIENRLVPAVEQAEIVVLATPLMAMEALFEVIGPVVSDGCVVTDVGSSKAIVLQWAEQYLPDRVNFVAGHPMAGSEASGPSNADGRMFSNKVYCVIPSRNASERAVSEITTLVEAIGAKPLFIGAEEHDSFVAAASHLPFILSVALVGCTSKSPNWQEISSLAASGYRDISRLASGDVTMHRDICHSNSEPIVGWIDAAIKELQEYRTILSDPGSLDSGTLENVFEHAKTARGQWMAGSVQQENRILSPQTEMPTFGDGMAQMFFGRQGTRLRKLMSGWGDSKEKK
ncbi:MAG: prephenate dehydrogenase [Dehalococcoidia bacterium]|nr:prephenate dehydrogenase [Dehalococcoidia bacterium]